MNKVETDIHYPLSIVGMGADWQVQHLLTGETIGRRFSQYNQAEWALERMTLQGISTHQGWVEYCQSLGGN